MKIGKFTFNDMAAKKPISISSSGKLLTAVEIADQPSLSLESTLMLSKDKQIELTMKRYELEPDFKLGVVGVGILSKKEIMEAIKRQDDFGKIALDAEMKYCNELITGIKDPNTLPSWPAEPKEPLRKIPEKKVVGKYIWIKLKTRVLFTEDTNDNIANPFAQYRIANVHPVFAARGFTVISLTGSNDIRTQFVPSAKNGLTVYLSGIGHGNYNLYTGYLGDKILEVGMYDPTEVKSKAIHYLSCRTAGQLGPDTVRNGAKSYAGYNENFTFVWDNSTTPVNEFLLFAKCDSTYDLWMAKGATALQAFNATVAAFNAALVEPGIPGSAAATWLTYNRNHLRNFGTDTTIICPYRYIRIMIPVLELVYQNALVDAGELVEA